MQFDEVIIRRRALRSLGKVEITRELMQRLAEAASLAASCANNQPWRFIFVHEEKTLKALFEALTSGNYWAKKASLMIVVITQKGLDCVINEREYYLFDTGMATAHLLLKATDLGLVAHPMAGFSPAKAKEVLNIPDDMELITLIAVGRQQQAVDPDLSEKHREQESQRPTRLNVPDFVYFNRYVK